MVGFAEGEVLDGIFVGVLEGGILAKGLPEGDVVGDQETGITEGAAVGKSVDGFIEGQRVAFVLEGLVVGRFDDGTIVGAAADDETLVKSPKKRKSNIIVAEFIINFVED